MINDLEVYLNFDKTCQLNMLRKLFQDRELKAAIDCIMYQCLLHSTNGFDSIVLDFDYPVSINDVKKVLRLCGLTIKDDHERYKYMTANEITHDIKSGIEKLYLSWEK